ncbi:SDR family NAD(P)-dependent oxidoreductase [Promethearchaeum syntrophicum]|uniref:SDR family NAD(P)-dependent oxidoreductase n=1 Tax=Promethearchaeum syntrophicum TaxID=2594042 RepID=A0A5B9DGN2_9ARCH|nr:SDR family NAD(P)-dependent oxidoreductase [Candidatus Prometheoarchaeum syntrophicum]QEE17910.1 short chain dehydrogenase [Candidatus Prometheoarchaeum syntrophicum]
MKVDKNLRSILITGASTGIGRETTEFLAKNGFHVYAGARKDKDITSLSQIPNVTPLKLDVTKSHEIEDAFSLIETNKTGLFAVINNAGIDVLGPLVDFDIEAFKLQLDVNLLGVHRIISKFFPLILQSEGRIINISSGMGLASVPFSGFYCASKAGLEAYNDSLRRELMLINKKIKVIIIEPGIVKTSIWKKDYPKDLESSLFHQSYLKWQKINVSPYEPNKKSLTPDIIARKIYISLIKKRPKLRYLVTERNFIYRILFAAPEKLKDWALRLVISRQKID